MNFTVGEYFRLLSDAGQLRGGELFQSDKTEVSGMTYESGKARPGCMFICKGEAFKKEYLEEAIARGSVCYVSEQDYGLSGVPRILVRDIRKAMPILAKKFYQVPDNALRYIGITGTKGKTTTAYYIKGIFDRYMDQTGEPEIACLTSMENYDGKEREAASLTTPESLELFRHFRNAWESGITCLAMEVSSQALKYGRVDGIRFDVGVFLNIAEDHISPMEHQNFEDYFDSKLQLFRQVRTAVVNLDSEFSRRILQAASEAERIITFGMKPGADIYGHDIRSDGGKVQFSVSCDQFEKEFTLAMHGIFNVENALAAIAVAYACQIPPEAMELGLSTVQVEGRMEEYCSRDQRLKVIVDYAHNGMSFEKLFDSVKTEYPDHKIVSVFGCPGGKALNRREDMGLAAGNACSRIYLTSDDPGTENIQDIFKAIGKAVERTGCPYQCIEDRETAIKRVVEEAESHTVVVVLGKGRETSQKIGCERYACRSDSEIVKECIERYDREHFDCKIKRNKACVF